MWVFIILLIAAAIYVGVIANDENIDILRIGALIIFIPALFCLIYFGFFCSSYHDTALSVSMSLVLVLGILGYVTEKKCGFLAQGCKKCGRKDSWHIKAEGKDVIDRVYKGQDKNGNAVYYEVADIYFHGRCDNCGYEEEWVERKSRNTTY